MGGNVAPGGMISALAALPAIAHRLAARQTAIFLDYDGTLTPIAARPDRALLGTSMAAVLTNLAQRCPLAVVSGRDRADIERLIGLPGLYYVGSHGFDIAGPDGLRLDHRESGRHVATLRAAEAELRHDLRGIAGILIEGKAFAVAVHYRLVDPARVAEIDVLVDRAVARNPGLRRTGGKMVFELRPAIAWDKGRAVLWLLNRLGLDRANAVPIYIGDDETDEDAFHALEDRGIGILVTDRPDAVSRAAYTLANVPEVERFLTMLAGLLTRPGSAPA